MQKIRSGGLRWQFVLIAYTIIAVAVFANVWTAPASSWVGVDGDPDSTIWSLAWSAYSLTHFLNPFVTDWIFYPTGTDVLWSNADGPIALGWVAAPITLTLGPIVAYNVLQTLCFALSAFTAYLAFRRFVGRAATAFLGALVYGFGPYMFGQAYGHLALTFAVLPPLIFILIDRLLVRRDLAPLPAGVLAGVIEAFQLLVSEELVVSTAIVTVVGVACLALTALVLRRGVRWADAIRRSALAAATAAVTFGVLGGYPLYVLFRGPARITNTPVRPFGYYATDIFNLVVPPGTTHLLHNDWTEQVSKFFPGGAVEAGGYLGVALILVLVYTSLRWINSPPVLFGASAGALVLLITLGPHLVHMGRVSSHVTLPWILAAKVPPLNDVLVDRMSLYVDFFAAFLFSQFLDRAWSWPSAPARAGAALAAAVSLLLIAPTLPWVASTAHVPEMFQPGTLANRNLHAVVAEGEVALILPADLVEKDHGYSMLWQATDQLHFKMPEGDLVHGDRNGNASMDPEPSALWSAVQALQNGAQPDSSAAALAAVRDDLDRLHIRAVVVGPMPRIEMVAQYFTMLLGKPPLRTGDVLFWSRSFQ